MKKNKVIYQITIGIISLVSVFSIYKLFSPDYDRLGLPNYLRVELTIFKILGIIVLLLPQFPIRIKEWAYAGFGITFISAFVAHYSSGDSLARSLEPIVFLIVLAVSNLYFHKVKEE
jgi:hypothetical protein